MFVISAAHLKSMQYGAKTHRKPHAGRTHYINEPNGIAKSGRSVAYGRILTPSSC